MKRFHFEWIWQWRNGSWIGFNPIGIELEYDKFEPLIGIMVVVMGVGFQFLWSCPWETNESIFAKQCMDMFSIDPELLKEVPGESQEAENFPTTREER